MRRGFLTVGSMVVFLTTLALALHFVLPDIGRAKDLAGIVQASAAALAIAAGGVFAGYKLQVFRDFEPHLTVSQTVSHRPVGTRHVHIAVTATLRNSSKVRVEIRKGFFQLQQIAPIDDDDVEFFYGQASGSKGIPDFDWPLLGEFSLVQGQKYLVIEPGETHHESCEFIASSDVESILVYSFFENMHKSESSRSADEWTATTVHDIVKVGQRVVAA